MTVIIIQSYVFLHKKGLLHGPYNERYCNSFQTTINEAGLCYTFNNYNLGTKGMSEDGIFKVSKVEGCGRSKGLRLVVDSQKLAYKSKKVHKQKSTGKEI